MILHKEYKLFLLSTLAALLVLGLFPVNAAAFWNTESAVNVNIDNNRNRVTKNAGGTGFNTNAVSTDSSSGVGSFSFHTGFDDKNIRVGFTDHDEGANGNIDFFVQLTSDSKIRAGVAGALIPASTFEDTYSITHDDDGDVYSIAIDNGNFLIFKNYNELYRTPATGLGFPFFIDTSMSEDGARINPPPDAQWQFFRNPPNPPSTNQILALTNQSSYTISGTSGRFFRINITQNGTKLSTARSDFNGVWSQAVTLAEGVNTFSITAASGIELLVSTPSLFDITLNSTLPTATAIPVITVSPTTLTTIEAGSVIDLLEGVTSSDNSLVTTSGNFNVNLGGTYTITYNSINTFGAAVPVTRVYNVQDTTAPTFKIKGNAADFDTLVELGDEFVFGVATEIFDASGTKPLITTSIPEIQLPIPSVGQYSIFYNITDRSRIPTNNGNTGSIREDVTVSDTTAPTFEVKGNTEDFSTIVDLGTNVYTVGTITNISDFSNTDAGVISGDTEVNSTAIGTYLVTYTVTDTAATPNVGTITETVSVQAFSGPVITVSPSSIFREKGDPIPNFLEGVSSNISSTITHTGEFDPNTLGTYTITYSTVDTDGISARDKTRTYIVRDTIKPIITVSPINISHEKGDPIPNFLEGVSTDDGSENGFIAPWSVREYHQVVSFNDALWLLGGVNTNYENDVRKSTDGINWTEVITTGTKWSERARHQAVVFNNALWILGGIGSDGKKNDVWTSTDGSTWTQVDANGSSVNGLNAPWSAREYHQVVSFDSALWLLGGLSTGGRANDVWKSTDGTTWTQIDSNGSSDAGDLNAPWSARNSHQVVSHNNTLWLLGGYDGANQKNDIWKSTDGITWEQVDSNGSSATGDLNAPWSVRHSHQVVSFNNTIWLLGGADGNNSQNDIWKSTDGTTWIQVDANGSSDAGDLNAPWSARHSHQVVSNNNALWLLGGLDGSNNRKNDVWKSLDGSIWTGSDASIITASGTVNINIVGTHTITYSSADVSGNAAVAKTRTYTVADTTKPIFAVDGNIEDFTTNVEQNGSYTVGTISNIFDLSTTNSGVISGNTNVNTSIVGTYTVTYTVTDNAATPNFRTITETVSVQASTGPVITVNPVAISLVLNSDAPDLLAGVSASDSSTVSASGTVDVSTRGTYVISYSATNAANVPALLKRRVYTIGDTTPPIITVNPLTITLERGSAIPELLDGVSINDNSSISISGTVNINLAGTYTVTYFATDSSGNAAIAKTRIYTVVDTTPPVITVSPNAISHERGSQTPGLLVGVTVDDNISAINTSQINFLEEGDHIVTYSSTDSSGNIATPKTRTYTVADTISPTFSVYDSVRDGAFVEDFATTVTEGETYTVGNIISIFDQGSATDGGVISGNENVDTSIPGTYLVRYAVTDISNASNSHTIIETVSVVDLIAPIITVNPLTITLERGTTPPDFLDGVETDDNSLITTANLPNINVVASYTTTYSSTDSFGNIATPKTRTYIVSDTRPPSLSYGTIEYSGEVVASDTIYLNENDTITIPVIFSETLSSYPTLQLKNGTNNLGSPVAQAGTGNTRNYIFTVSANQNLDLGNLKYKLEAETLTDLGGNDSSLITEQSINNVVVDNTSPTLSLSVEEALIKSGDTITIRSIFEDNVGFGELAENVNITIVDPSDSSITHTIAIPVGLTTTTTTSIPTTFGEGAISTINVDSFADRAGNLFNSSTSLTLGDLPKIDNTAPTISNTPAIEVLPAKKAFTISIPVVHGNNVSGAEEIHFVFGGVGSCTNISNPPIQTIQDGTVSIAKIHTNTLSATKGLYSGCSVKVVDGVGNESAIKVITDFNVFGGGGAGLVSGGSITPTTLGRSNENNFYFPNGQITETQRKPLPNIASFISFNKELTFKSSSPSVKRLQQFLNEKGFSVSLTGAGSRGSETNYFGSKTVNALIKYQIANGLEGIGKLNKETIENIKLNQFAGNVETETENIEESSKVILIKTIKNKINKIKAMIKSLQEKQTLQIIKDKKLNLRETKIDVKSQRVIGTKPSIPTFVQFPTSAPSQFNY